jgi:hypothetical protein
LVWLVWYWVVWYWDVEKDSQGFLFKAIIMSKRIKVAVLQSCRSDGMEGEEFKTVLGHQGVG